jgi:hypothetical protein
LKTETSTQSYRLNPPLNFFHGRSFPLIWLLAITALYVLLRLSHIGHPLAWDEAWILNAVKSLAEGGDATFQNQLWRHPPVYLGFGLLLSPLKQDFALRMEILSLIIHTGALLVFVVFIAKILGNRIALYTGIAYAMLPGAIFYSTWIKRDSLVIFFCLLAIWAFYKKKDLLAGVLLSLGFLSKESAFFYALSLAIMIPVLRPRKSLWRTYITIFTPIFLISGWWYMFYASGTKGHLLFFRGTSEETSQFSKPWWYYFTQLKHDIGIPGLILFATGLISFIPIKNSRLKSITLRWYLKKPRFLPLYILLPGYLVLTLSHGKPPWMTIVFYPFLALIIGLGWQFLLQITPGPFNKITTEKISIIPIFSGLLLVLILSLSLIKFDYMEYLSEMSPGTSNVIQRSYRIAEAVNQATGDNDKLLVMPMIIQPELKTQPDPILFWHLKPSLRTFRVNSLSADYNVVKDLIVSARINKLLIFPVEGSIQEKITTNVIKDIKPDGLSLPGKILILDVEGYWKKSNKDLGL